MNLGRYLFRLLVIIGLTLISTRALSWVLIFRSLQSLVLWLFQSSGLVLSFMVFQSSPFFSYAHVLLCVDFRNLRRILKNKMVYDCLLFYECFESLELIVESFFFHKCLYFGKMFLFITSLFYLEFLFNDNFSIFMSLANFFFVDYFTLICLLFHFMCFEYSLIRRKW